MAAKGKLQKVTGKLNVVLRPEDITAILRKTMGPTGARIPSPMLVKGHCCVNVSVGSSVAGPVSSVASSVAIVEPKAAARKVAVKAPVARTMVKVSIPKNLKIK